MKERTIVVAGIALVVLILGGMLYVTLILFGPARDEAIELVPADSVMYGNVFLDPSNDQKRAIEDLLAKFDKVETPDRAEDFIANLVDDAFEREDIDATYENDVKPWLGEQVAFFFTEFEDPEAPDGAALIEVEDEDAFRDLIAKADEATGDFGIEDRRTYKDVDYVVYEDDVVLGFVREFAVVGTEDGLKAAVDVSEGADSLADSDDYESITGRLNDDRLAIFYFDLQGFLGSAAVTADMAPEERQVFEEFRADFEGGAAVTAYAEADGAVLESVSPLPEDSSLTPLTFTAEGVDIGALPGQSWLALGFADLGGIVEGFFDLGARTQGMSDDEREQIEQDFEDEVGLNLEEDIFDALGDVRLFLQGGIIPNGPTGAVIVEVVDEDKALELVGKIDDALAQNGVPIEPIALEGYDSGFTFEDPGLPQRVHVVADGSRIVGGWGDAATLAALEGAEALEDSQDFQDAAELLGDDFEPSFYLETEIPAAAVATSLGMFVPDYNERVAPWVDPIAHLTSGTKRDGDFILQRLVIGVEQETEEG